MKSRRKEAKKGNNSKLANISEEKALKQAKTITLKLLAYRFRSRKEIERHLLQKGFSILFSLKH